MGGPVFFDVFQIVAKEAGVPERLWSAFSSQLELCRDNPKQGAKVAEKWLSQFEFHWPEGLEYTQKFLGQKGTFKQLSAVFSRYISRKILQEEQLVRAARNRSTHPYLKLSRGTSMLPCPVHGADYGIVLLLDHSYWSSHPLRASVFCDCSIRSLSKREFARVIADI